MGGAGMVVMVEGLPVVPEPVLGRVVVVLVVPVPPVPAVPVVPLPCAIATGIAKLAAIHGIQTRKACIVIVHPRALNYTTRRLRFLAIGRSNRSSSQPAMVRATCLS